MKLTKAQREILRNKFGGKCAYCGGDLPARWHADHLKPIERKLIRTERGLTSSTECHRPENDCIENLMPSCPPCNISKAGLSIENWREWLLGHVRAFNAHSAPYRLCKAYGLIVETGNPIKFYFEQDDSLDGQHISRV